MWNKLICPICDKALRAIGTVENFSKVYRKKTLYRCKLGELLAYDAYHIEPHFKMEQRDDQNYSETFFYYPFFIESYPDVSNIYIYDEKRKAKRFILETPYLNLNWKDKDTVIQKLKIYTLFL